MFAGSESPASTLSGINRSSTFNRGLDLTEPIPLEQRRDCSNRKAQMTTVVVPRTPRTH